MIKLNAQAVTIDAAAGDTPSRTITGVAVPYGETATVSDGTQVRFEKGALPVEGKAPKLFMYHDSSMPVGLVTERVDTEEGMMFSARISATVAGDEALTLALDGVLDSVSVGVNPTRFSYDDEGTMVVTEAEWLELSLVPIPAFAGAVIEHVLASAQEPDTEPTSEPVEETPTVESVQPEAVVEAATPTAPIPAQPKRKFALPTPGEYMAAMHIGGTTFANVNAAVRDFVAANQTALQAAAGDVLTTDTPGLLPVPVLGPVFDDLNYIRPVVSAIGARAMPDGGQSKTWIRPTWTTHTDVGSQSPELGAVTARTPVIASNVVTKTTLAGQVTLSVQDVDFTSPAALEIILRDLAGQYMIQSDAVACNAILAGDTASGSTWTVTANDPTSLIAALYDAATDILQATNFLPDHIFVSSDVWKKLGSQLNGNKEPVFPYTGAAGLMGVNGMGTANVTQMNTFNPLGLNLVVDRAFSENTMVVARGTAIEFYEQVRGIMSVEVPSTLGRTFSYYGYVSTFIADGDQVKSIAIA
jgi:HK97 family phage prohead protease